MSARTANTTATTQDGYLRLTSLSKYFGAFEALSDVSLDISEGEFICFLGPSGCGKTTLLRCIAGLETQTSGEIFLAGENISRLPPSRRDFGIVFQSYALFPNLKVCDNVAYGLVNNKTARVEIDEKVSELLALVGLSDHAGKYPGQLSGGEQQRVALVRALATSPGLLLLDEPLSALDAKVRAHLRREIREIQDRLGVTTIMVTHDQEEAQTMADRIFVMNQGRIEQTGTPSEIYEQPETPFVADFIGVMNFIPATVIDAKTVVCGDAKLQCDAREYSPQTQLNCAVRPEDLVVGAKLKGTKNILDATITEHEHLGSFVRLFLDVPALNSSELMVDVSKDLLRDGAILKANKIQLSIPPNSIRLYAKGV